ncbi:nicotinate phosphoribosyltransferase [candidate division KSB1 bacterium]|nr:nicotinate phosphoribosyltransferase [candidate division KSB1 bacterium]
MNKIDYSSAEGILFTDQYELTMAQLYFDQNLHENEAQFDYFYRHNPDYGHHQAGFAVAAGLEWLIKWLHHATFQDKELDFLARQKSRSGKALFSGKFLDYLRKYGDFKSLTIKAIPEGRVVHPNVPLVIVQGPLMMAQILETRLLNIMNYQTLIATKAARLSLVASDSVVLEFGARRGADKGANAGARAALIGGADFTSNTGISHTLGLPPKGTHAHSMVQAYLSLGMSELDAFRAYAETYPDDCLLLVDTIDTLNSGVPNAITVFEELREKGHKPVGIRLDSGDLAFLAIQVECMLEKAGFADVSIVLSNQLDEMVIWQIQSQIRNEAKEYGVDAEKLIRKLIYGVGTRLITSKGSPALGGVYKLVALKDGGDWQPVIKLSESAAKIPIPGNKQVWRLYDQKHRAIADVIGMHDENPQKEDEMDLHHPYDANKKRIVKTRDLKTIESLLQTVYKQGMSDYDWPVLSDMREKLKSDVERLYPGVRRLIQPHRYHVSLTRRMFQTKEHLIEQAQSQ